MIIDTTVSVLEERVSKLRRLDELSDRQMRRRTRQGYRQSAIRDFLLKQGKEVTDTANYVAFWENNELTEVHLLSEEPDRQESDLDPYLQNTLDKFIRFMDLLNHLKEI